MSRSRVSLQTGTSSVTSDLDFSSARLVTDSALENITEWRQFSGEDMFRSKLRLQIRIDDFRKAQGGLTNTDIFYSSSRKLIDSKTVCCWLYVAHACMLFPPGMVEVKYLQIRFIDFYLDLIDIYLDQTSYLDCTK